MAQAMTFPSIVTGIGPLRLVSLSLLAMLSVAASSYKLLWFADIWQTDILPLSLALLTGALVNILARLALRTLAEHNGQRLVVAYRQALFSRMLDADIESGPNRLGVAMNRLISDANSVAHFAGRGLGYLQMGILGCLCFGWYLFTQNTAVASALWLVLLAVALCLGILTPWALRLAAEIRRSRGRLSGHLSERCFGYLTVGRSNTQARESKRVLERGRALACQLVQWQCLLLCCRSLGPLCGFVALIYASPDFSLKHWPHLIRVLTLSLFLLSLDYLVRSWADWVNFFVARQRLSLAYDKMQPVAKDAKRRLARKQSYALKIRKVQLVEAAPTIDEEIPPGARLLVCGPQGKSAFCRLLAQQAAPASGYLVLGSYRFSNIARNRLHQLVCVIDEHSQLFKGSVYSNILYGTGLKKGPQALAAAEWVGIAPELLENSVNELGRGCSQLLYARILLARALLLRPAVLVLDHPVFIAHPQVRHLVALLAKDQPFTLIQVVEPELSPFEPSLLLDMESGRLQAVESSGLVNTAMSTVPKPHCITDPV